MVEPIVKLAKPAVHIPIGFLTVDCGKCGNRTYEIGILPQEKRGKIFTLTCANSKCKNVLRVDNGWIEGEGEIDLHGSKHLVQGVKQNG